MTSAVLLVVFALAGQYFSATPRVLLFGPDRITSPTRPGAISVSSNVAPGVFVATLAVGERAIETNILGMRDSHQAVGIDAPTVLALMMRFDAFGHNLAVGQLPGNAMSGPLATLIEDDAVPLSVEATGPSPTAIFEFFYFVPKSLGEGALKVCAANTGREIAGMRAKLTLRAYFGATKAAIHIYSVPRIGEES